MSEPFVGEIRMFGFNFAPVGWALCDGQLMAIAQNQALFSLLGTTYGGDGQSTFGLPNLQSRVAIHMGQGPGLTPYFEGQTGGVESVALTAQQMPQHNHAVNCNGSVTGRGGGAFGAGGVGETPVSNFPGPATSPGHSVYSTTAIANNTMAATMISQAGGSQAHENRQPFLVMNFCIALQGIFPSRG